MEKRRLWVDLGAKPSIASKMVATRRLAAIVATDIAGYSRLMEADEEGTLAPLRAIRRELGEPKVIESGSTKEPDPDDAHLARRDPLPQCDRRALPDVHDDQYTKEAMFPHTGTWTLNEFVLVGGDATSDNLPPRFSQIQYAWRSPSLGIQQQIYVLGRTPGTSRR